MEQFVFGMLTIVALIGIAVIVVGVVKIYRLMQKVDSIGQYMEDSTTQIHQRISNEVDYNNRNLSEATRDLSLRIDKLNSYVDSRFDKVLSKKSK